jgi:hypothetical protein
MNIFVAIENKLGLKLTRRGKLVIGWALFAVVFAVFGFLFDATTPEACKVPLEQMSAWCQGFVTQ